MVDMDRLKEEAVKGAYVGAGLLAFERISAEVEGRDLPGGEFGVGLVEAVIGIGASSQSDRFLDRKPNKLLSAEGAVRFAGYGIQGEAYRDLASVARGASPSRASQTRRVEVTTNGGTSGGAQEEPEERRRREEFLADVG